MATKIEKDEISGTPTTGHEWDGIKELNTPLPKWWLYTFYATVIWAIGYTIAYPAWPLLSSATPGLLGYSSRASWPSRSRPARPPRRRTSTRSPSMSVDDILKDPNLLSFAQAGGAAAFKVNCVQCHGSGAAGSAGYPNLNDDDWLWGGSARCHLRHAQERHPLHRERRDARLADAGLRRRRHPDAGADRAGRQLCRLALGRGGGSGARRRPASRSSRRTAPPATARTPRAAAISARPTSPTRSRSMARALDQVKAQIVKPRHGVMPGWSHRLDDATIKQLAVYVHSLGGGEAAVPATQ